MALVFQYGSNMSTQRLNGQDRLAGGAKVIGVAQTVEPYELAFTVWSSVNNCAAADIVANPGGRSLYGILYDIPNSLIYRSATEAAGARSLDAIEGEGKYYVRKNILVKREDGSEVQSLTYVVKSPDWSVKTEAAYVNHIIAGIDEHSLPEEYRRYVLQRVILNNPELSAIFE